jgi:hypothetical protein
LAVHLEDGLAQVDDPVVGDARAGVQTPLARTVAEEAVVGDLDGQDRSSRVAGAIVAGSARDDAGVGLRLGLVVERDGELGANRPALSERSSQGLLDELHRGRMRACLGLVDDQLSAEELDRLVLVEDPERDQMIILRACPAAGAR